jgi:hypothetical protein
MFGFVRHFVDAAGVEDYRDRRWRIAFRKWPEAEPAAVNGMLNGSTISFYVKLSAVKQ